MDHHLQNKLQQYSATPPEGVWQKIAGALDEETAAHRLLHYEEAPPATAWQNIEKSLNEDTPANVVPFTTRFRRPLRYAAVACFLAVTLVTATLTMKHTEAGALDPELHTERKSGKAAVVTTTAEKPQQDQPAEELATTNGVAKKSPTSLPPAAEAGTTASRSDNSGKKGKAADGAVYSSLNEYVFFSDGDGQLRKVSKKLASFVNCKDDDIPCKQRLKELRQQMAAKTTTTDFTGVLDLLRHLQ